MSKILAILLVSTIVRGAHADTVGLDQFFSSDVFKGAIACDVLGGDPYLNEPTTVYDKPLVSAVAKEKKRPMAACAQGGGDCDCFFMFVDKAPATVQGKAFYKGRLHDGTFAWLLGDSKGESSIEKLAASMPNSELLFRTPAPPIYVSDTLTKTMSKEQLVEIPEDILKRIPVQNTQRQVLATTKAIRTITGRRVAQIEIVLVTQIPDDQEWNDEATHVKSEQRTHLRDAWIPIFDSAGRIGFWMARPPGC